MSRFFALALVAGLAPALNAQIKVQIKTLNDAGFQLVRGDNTTVQKHIPANTTIQRYSNQYHYDRTPYTYVGTYVSAPYTFGSITYNRIGVSTRAYARKGSNHKSLHMSGDKSGKVGTQRYEVAITTTKSTPVILDLSAYASIYDNSNASFKLTGGGVNESMAWSKPGYSRVAKKINMTVNGTVKLTLEATGVTKPGSGSHQYYDGYFSSLYVTVVDGSAGSFTTFGKGCGKATIRGSGKPAKGTRYPVHVDGAPANSPVAFLLGRSKDWFHFFKLPLAMDYMGATGCALNVGFTWPWTRMTDANGHAEVPIYLSSFYSGTYYVQWVVIDTKANAAGITLTKGAELKF